MSNRKVVVVGAGSVGLVTGLGLAQRGFSVTVLERQPAPTDGLRDMIYHWCVLPLFAGLGMLDGMLQQGIACHECTVVAPSTGEVLHLDLGALADVTEHPFNLNLTLTKMTAEATRLLADLPDSTIEWGVEVSSIEQDPFGVTVKARRTDGTETAYRADWVIGADGSHSVVRRSLGLGFAGTTWPKQLISCDLRLDLASLGHGVESTQIDPVHGALIAKVDRTGLWRYTAAESRTLPPEHVSTRAAEAMTAALGVDDLRLQAVVPFRVHQRSAETFRVGRAVLVGDAAHLTNPTRALGMLSGLFDAKLLIDTLASTDTLGEGALDRYSLERARNFRDITSPRSNTHLEFMFSRGAPAQLDERMARYRKIANSRDETRRFFLEDLDCESASPLGSDAGV